MNKKTIHVTQNDINEGFPGNGAMCPVALACRREFGLEGTLGWVAVGDYIHIKNKYWPSPLTVKAFIAEFDGGSPVIPFEFSIDLDEAR